MLKLHVIQAQFGDCLILEFGTGGKPRFVLIDGGPAGNYDADLSPALKGIIGEGGKLDLLVLSHADNDHAVGVLDLLAAVEDDVVSERAVRTEVVALWLNSFGRSLDPSGEISQRIQSVMEMAGVANVAMPLAADAYFGMQEGNRIRLIAKKLKIPLNKGFKDDLILVETAKKAVKLGPLQLRIAGPNRANLTALRKEWLDWLAKTETSVAEDPATAANADRSIPNLSSIVILATAGGKTILLTGDARGDHIIDGLKTAGLAKNGKLHVDVLKVQHHGSCRNATRAFFDAVTADTYVISANGKYGNPDLETLKWIVQSAHDAGRHITVVVTNETASTKELKKKLAPGTYGYDLKAIAAGRHGIEIPLA